MLKRMMASALALTGVAYAQAPVATAPQATGAAAPAPDASGRIVYDAAFFAQFNPQNASDMVDQTPGFTLLGGDDRRGFSGAVGNLLIDGVRPSTKSQSLGAILARIPANQVVRLEILRGADVAGDASGQATLLNVVRTPSAGSGLWRLGGEYNRDIFGPQGELSYSGRSGQIEYGAGLSIYSQYREQVGRRTIYDSAGAITRRATTPSPRDFREATLTANFGLPLWGGRLNTNAQYNVWRFHSLNNQYFTDPNFVPTDSLIDNFTERGTGLEFGANYERDIGPWQLGLIGLINRDTYESEDAAANLDTAANPTFVFAQDLEQESGETILRGTLSRALNSQHRIEFGLEGAFNTLDQTVNFSSGTGPSALARQFVPNGNVLVEEERAEAFVVHTYRPDDRWTFETRLAGEQSTLTFTGDSDQVVELSYFKPSFQVSRQLGARNQLRLRVFRDIDQLDFGDFVSAVGITENIINGGNTNLVPETSWRAEAAADLRFPGDIALNTSVMRYWLTDASDVVLLVAANPDEDPLDPDDDLIFFDAPGNIGDGDVWNWTSRLTLPLRAIIPGARLTLTTTFWQSAVTDSVTGNSRSISGLADYSYEGEFRQDVRDHDLAWGVYFFKQSESQTFRANEVDTFQEGPWVDVFVESTAIEGMRIRLVAANVLDGDIDRSRTFFGDGNPSTPDSRNDPLLRLDDRHREFGHDPWFVIAVSGSF